MKNMENFIKQHNARVLKNQENSEKRSCSCRVKDNCLLDGKYLHEYIVYQANVVTSNEYKEYLEQLKENLNCATITTPCHLDTRNV